MNPVNTYDDLITARNHSNQPFEDNQDHIVQV